MQNTRRRDHKTAEGGERCTPPPIDGVELPLLEGALAREVSRTADQCRRHGLRAEAAHAATVQQPHKMDAHERGWSAACLGHQRPLVQRSLVRVEEPSSHSGRHAERELRVSRPASAHLSENRSQPSRSPMRRESRRERESVFTRPTDLDAIVARAAASDDASSAWETGGIGGAHPGRDDARSMDDSSLEMLEDAQREAEVARQQVDHLAKQLRGAVAELELHRRHGREFKALLEESESDLCAAHEHAADLQQRLQLAQEGNRRNSDMAQQLLRHLNSTRVELKAQARRTSLLESELAASRAARTDEAAERHGASSDAEGHEGVAPDSPVSQDMSSSHVPLLARLGPRAALTPVTHEIGVQVDSGRADLLHSRMGGAKMVALQHAKELEHQSHAQRAVEAVNMEARPGAAADCA